MVQETIARLFRGDSDDEQTISALNDLVEQRVRDVLDRLGVGGAEEPAPHSPPNRGGPPVKRQASDAGVATAIVEHLQQQGLAKTNIASRLLLDEVYRAEDGRLYADRDGERVPYKAYIAEFLQDNPELLPPRIAGGAGSEQRNIGARTTLALEDIRPGMDSETHRRAWDIVSRLSGSG